MTEEQYLEYIQPPPKPKFDLAAYLEDYNIVIQQPDKEKIL
jgi:hypothetical protein